MTLITYQINLIKSKPHTLSLLFTPSVATVHAF